MLRWLLLFAGCLAGSGCVIFNSRDAVSNPIPELSNVAVVPFFNLSAERAVDGRQFAAAYFAELQKTPGFKVVPVGVTEVAIRENNLNMDTPIDALRLAEILDVDAVVVGAVTDYDPYYPPRIGLEVSWFSPRTWEFAPGIQVDPYRRRKDRYQEKFEAEQRHLLKKLEQQKKKKGCTDCPPDFSAEFSNTPAFRGQSPDPPAEGIGVWKNIRHALPVPHGPSWRNMLTVEQPAAEHASPADNDIQQVAAETFAVDAAPTYIPSRTAATGPMQPAQLVPIIPPPLKPLPDETDQPPPLAPIQERSMKTLNVTPIMSYTRIFDATDPKLVANLRDYVELTGDQRSGGWEAYLQRSDDFIRFASHLMITEMLMLHGGEGKRQFVFKFRKFK